MGEGERDTSFSGDFLFRDSEDFEEELDELVLELEDLEELELELDLWFLSLDEEEDELDLAVLEDEEDEEDPLDFRDGDFSLSFFSSLTLAASSSLALVLGSLDFLGSLDLADST